MLNLAAELKSIITALAEQNIDYAVCGGLAMAVYGLPRATVDIDLLILADDLQQAKETVKRLGYTIEAMPMKFSGGAIEICRLSKLDAETSVILPLDLLLVTPQIRNIWESRVKFEWESSELWIVSREGLIELKSLRGSGQDQDDIKHLREAQDES